MKHSILSLFLQNTITIIITITYINDVVLNSEHVIYWLKRCDAGVAVFVHLRCLVHNSNLSDDKIDDDNDQ